MHFTSCPAVNTVIAFGYYGRLASRMWFEEASEEHSRGGAINVPFALQAALGITVIATILFGVLPSAVTHFSDFTLVAQQ